MNWRSGALSLLATILLSSVAACSPSSTPLPEGAIADRIVVTKASRQLTLFAKGVPLKSYTVALGRNPNGPKTREGDNRTPEGSYVVDWHNPNSGYHRALHISYPNARDREQARAAGARPGGDIMIHGMRNGFGWVGRLHRMVDWTQGCIAVTNQEIDEISRVVPDGAVVEIRP